MAEETRTSADDAQVEQGGNTEQFIENKTEGSLEHLKKMATQFPHLLDDEMKQTLYKSEEPKQAVETKQEEVPSQVKKEEEVVSEEKAVEAENDSDDIFGLTKKKTISKEFEGLEEFMGVIKDKHSIEDPNTLLNSIGKWRKDSQKANEYTEKYDSLMDDLNSLPLNLKSSISAFANGEDYMEALKKNAPMLDLDKPFDKQYKEDLVKTYFNDRYDKLKTKLESESISEEDFNENVDDLHALSERLYNSDKVQHDNQRADVQKRQSEYQEELKNSAISSVESLKKTFPNFSDNEFNKVKQRLVSQDLDSVFFTKDGKYRDDAAERIALALYGQKVINKLVSHASREAESKTTQKFVERGNTELRANKAVSGADKDELSAQVKKSFGGLFTNDVYS